MTPEELDASIALAKLVGFSCIEEENDGGWMVFAGDGDSLCEWWQDTEREAWVEAFEVGVLEETGEPMPRYATDLDALFALARAHDIGLELHVDEVGYIRAHAWFADRLTLKHVSHTPALAACRALIEALKEMKEDGA